MAPERRGRPPRDAAPRIFLRRGVYAADLRRWDAGRPTLRNPDAPTWPAGGETTDIEEVALRWSLAYVDFYREAKRREQLKLGPAPKRLGVSIDDWLDYRADVEKRPRTTRDGNRSALNAVRRFACHDKASGRKGDYLRTDRLTEPFLQRLFDQLAREGYAYNTRVSYRQSISGYLRWLGHAEPNAALSVRIEKEEHQEVKTWSYEELEAIRAGCNELDEASRFGFRHHRRAIEFALASGARRNELFAIDWSHLDEASRTTRVQRQLHKRDRRFVTPKSKRPRTALILPSWWEHHDPDADGLMLHDVDGGPLSPQNLAKMGRRILSSAGIDEPGVGWHTFRHTYARNFIVAVAGNFGLLQKSLGHQSIVTTEKLYGHFHSETAADLARQRIYPEERLRVV